MYLARRNVVETLVQIAARLLTTPQIDGKLQAIELVVNDVIQLAEMPATRPPPPLRT